MATRETLREDQHDGRVIRPAGGQSVTLDERSFRLEDIGALTSALIEKSEGRLAQLNEATRAIEERLRAQIDKSRHNIQRARELAEEEISSRLEDASRRAAEVYRKRYDDGWKTGHEKGHAEGHDEGYAKGYEEGLEKGWEQGRQEGRAAAERELRESCEVQFEEETKRAVEVVRGLAAELGQEWEQSLAEARGGLLDVAIAVAEQILDREVRQVPETVVSTLERIWQRLGDEERVVVRIHPNDRSAIERFLPGFLEQQFGETSVQIAEDPNFLRGGCDVKGQRTLIEGAFNTQLQIARERLAEAGGVR